MNVICIYSSVSPLDVLQETSYYSMSKRFRKRFSLLRTSKRLINQEFDNIVPLCNGNLGSRRIEIVILIIIFTTLRCTNGMVHYG